MFSSFRYKRAVIILVIAFVLDFFIRVFFYNQMKLIVASEALLFLSISLIMLLAAKKDKERSQKAERFDLWFTLFFLLGGIRSALWTANVETYTANFIIIILGILLGVLLIRWRQSSDKPG
jgi:hypothetical protein